MGTVRRNFLFPALHVWEVMFDPDMWSINTQGFAPTLGRCFVIKDPPTLGTRFTGTCECVITDVQPYRRLEFEATAVARTGTPYTLIDTFEFVELPRETHCTFTVCGENGNNPDELLLDHFITESIHWGFHYINRKLERQAHRRPNDFGTRQFL